MAYADPLAVYSRYLNPCTDTDFDRARTMTRD